MKTDQNDPGQGNSSGASVTGPEQKALPSEMFRPTVEGYIVELLALLFEMEERAGELFEALRGDSDRKAACLKFVSDDDNREWIEEMILEEYPEFRSVCSLMWDIHVKASLASGGTAPSSIEQKARRHLEGKKDAEFTGGLVALASWCSNSKGRVVSA